MAPRRQRSLDTTELNTPEFKETGSVLRWLCLSSQVAYIIRPTSYIISGWHIGVNSVTATVAFSFVSLSHYV